MTTTRLLTPTTKGPKLLMLVEYFLLSKRDTGSETLRRLDEISPIDPLSDPDPLLDSLSDSDPIFDPLSNSDPIFELLSNSNSIFDPLSGSRLESLDLLLLDFRGLKRRRNLVKLLQVDVLLGFLFTKRDAGMESQRRRDDNESLDPV